jgi:uncharacterized protein (DUF488 family)
MNQAQAIYTIGHSTHEFAEFVELLKLHGVTLVTDVRSQPYSRLEHFRRGPLENALRAEGIAYEFLGRELGARREEADCYADGQAAYELVAQLPAFLEGLDRLQRDAAQHRIALVCAEREPLDCHRTVLVARQLTARGWSVHHILADGSLENHAETERRMVDAMGVDPLFDGGLAEDELIERAYAERGREIAFRASEEEVYP